MLLLGCVFGSYVVSGGSFDVLVEAVPFEMWTIGGAADRRLHDGEQHARPEACARRL